MLPEMIPVLPLNVSPAGSPVAVNVSGVWPVAGIANTSGVVARAANVNGPCRRGDAVGAVIEMVMVDCARAVPPIAPATTPTVIAAASTQARDCLRIGFSCGKSAGQAGYWLTNRTTRPAGVYLCRRGWPTSIAYLTVKSRRHGRDVLS